MRTFGCTERRRSSSAPMYPLAPVTATFSMAGSASGLPLRVLELRPGAGLAVLLALLHPRIAGEEAGPLERLAHLVVELQQGPRDASAGPARPPALPRPPPLPVAPSRG